MSLVFLWLPDLSCLHTNQFSSAQFSRSVLCDSLRPHELQHARLPCPSPTPGVHSDLRPSSPWCHPAISSSVVPFSSCPQSLPTSESFPMSQLFTWGGRSTGVSAYHHSFQRNPRADLLQNGWLLGESKQGRASQVALVVKNLPAKAGDVRCGFDPWVGTIPWRRAWQPTPVFLTGESPWTEEPGGLQSKASQRVQYDWSNLAQTADRH